MSVCVFHSPMTVFMCFMVFIDIKVFEFIYILISFSNKHSHKSVVHLAIEHILDDTRVSKRETKKQNFHITFETSMCLTTLPVFYFTPTFHECLQHATNDCYHRAFIFVFAMQCIFVLAAIGVNYANEGEKE